MTDLTKVSSTSELWNKIGLVLISGFLYAITIASVGLAAGYIPPFTLTAMRLTTASLIFCLIFMIRRPRVNLTRRNIPETFVIGLLNIGLPFLSLALAVKFISSSLASVLFNIQPVFTVLIAHWLLADEKLNLFKVIGMLCAVAGATLLVVLQESGFSTGNNNAWVGQLLILFACLVNAIGIVAAKVRLHNIDAPVLTASQVMASLLVIAPLALVIEGPPALKSYPLEAWVTMVLAAICAPVIAYWLMFYMMKRYSASLAGFSGIATPLFSILIGVLFLGEIVNLPILVGAALLLIGVWFLHYF